MAFILDVVQELKVVIFEGPVVLLRLVWLYIVAFYNFIVPFGFRSKEVHGETALITGGGSGLGRLLALKLARRGCCVVIWDVNKNGNEETADMIRAEGLLVHAYTCDLCDKNSIYRTAEQVRREVGDVDILINNAGVVSGRKFLDTPDDFIQRTMDVNINAHFWTLKAFLPAMMQHNHGHVVTVASLAGLNGSNGLVDYHASKFAAVGLDEALRDELIKLGKDGVHTTCVCPFYINTGMFDGVRTKMPILFPILDQDYVTNKIIEAILTNQEMLVLPRMINVLLMIKWFLPAKGVNLLMHATGASSCMDTFVGRKSD